MSSRPYGQEVHHQYHHRIFLLGFRLGNHDGDGDQRAVVDELSASVEQHSVAVEEVLLPLVFTVVEVLPAVVFAAEEVVRPVVFGAASVFLVAISNTPFRFSYKNLKITISQRLPFYNRQVLSNAILRFRVIETLKRKQRDYGISDVRCGGVAANVRR